MAGNEMFDSAVRSAGDRAGIFEYDGDTGYFYLYDMLSEQGKKVISCIRILTEIPSFGQGDIVIRWSSNQSVVGLFIREQLWAAFDDRNGTKYGGNYRAGTRSDIPLNVAKVFESQ